MRADVLVPLVALALSVGCTASFGGVGMPPSGDDDRPSDGDADQDPDRPWQDEPGGDGDADGDTEDPEDEIPNNPTAETFTLTLPAFDVRSGSERQVCRVVNFPSDGPVDIVMMRSTMSGNSHHFNAYKVLGETAPVAGADGEVHDCSPGEEQLSGDAAYFFGSAVEERTVQTPAGVAFHFEAGQQIILEQHVINATQDTMQGEVTFELTTAAEGAIEHHADIIWFANWQFIVLPGESETTTHCTVPYAVEIFGLSSHSHERGEHFSIEKWSSGQTEHLYDSNDWAHPPYEEYDPTVSLNAGEGLQWTCSWRNNGGIVIPGRESTNEMCITFAAAYPRDSLSGDPIQCNQGL
jgi:hypothetical protein